MFNLCVCVCTHMCILSTKRLVKDVLPLLTLWDKFSDKGGRKIDTMKIITLKVSYTAYPRGLGQVPERDINDL